MGLRGEGSSFPQLVSYFVTRLMDLVSKARSYDWPLKRDWATGFLLGIIGWVVGQKTRGRKEREWVKTPYVLVKAKLILH